MEVKETDQRNLQDIVVIIDDDEINRSILANIFEPYYLIKEAKDGIEGLEIVNEQPDKICAILLDVFMPRMNGIEVLQNLKKDGLLKKIPVFMITADPNDSIMAEIYQLGAMDIIAKPVVPYFLLRRIQSVIELFQARKHLNNVVEMQKDELLQRARTIIELNQGMIKALSTAIEFRNGESGEHVRRIHDITKYMLEHTELGKDFSQEEIDNIALAAIMHDVGKIAIPDAILNKPGRLTKEEYEIMKSHTVQGAKMLEKIPQLRENGAYHYAYDIARHHHERYDGNGYPDGLKGDEISIWSQIVSLADVYDALTSKRVYKDAFSYDKALEMIKNGECGIFNPHLLECFFAVEKEIRKMKTK